MASGPAAPLVVTGPTSSSVDASTGADTDRGLSRDELERPNAGPGLIPMAIDDSAGHVASMEAVEVKVVAATWNPPLWGMEGPP